MAATDARPGDVLSHGHLFGLKADVKSNVHFVDEHLVVYPCGHSVVFLHIESRAQQVSGAYTPRLYRVIPRSLSIMGSWGITLDRLWSIGRVLDLVGVRGVLTEN